MARHPIYEFLCNPPERPKYGRTGQPPTPPVLRFFRYVPAGLPPDVCWEWSGGRTTQGYGKFTAGSVYANQKSTLFPAHVAAYAIDHDDLREADFVLHSCDNPPCVNPAHLRRGTAKDNADDRTRRGRVAKKLTNAEVCRIRERYWSGEATLVSLADEHGVGKTTIEAAIQGRTHRYAGGPHLFKPGGGLSPTRLRRSEVAEERRCKAITLSAQGATDVAIAKELGVTPSQVARYLGRR